jgi:hypothetical protein
VLAEVIIRGPYSNPLEPTGMIAKQKVDNWGPRYKKDDNK